MQSNTSAGKTTSTWSIEYDRHPSDEYQQIWYDSEANITTSTIYIERLGFYKEGKESIYKWTEANREIYLTS